MADRIPCINLTCKRTGDPTKTPDVKEIICAKCWRLLPEEIRTRHKHLTRRHKRLALLTERRVANGTMPRYRIFTIGKLADRQVAKNTADIRAFLNNPERTVSLDDFLKEMHL